MSKKTTPQYAQIEQHLGIDPPNVHCPICGTVCNQEVPCEHLAFIHAEVLNDYVYKSEDYSKRLAQLEKEKEVIIDEEEFYITGDVESFLMSIGYDNKMLALEITYGGIAGGPVWYTDIFGFDYSTIKNKE